jgi:hypothetical protein
MSDGGNFNRAGRRSGGDKPFAITVKKLMPTAELGKLIILAVNLKKAAENEGVPLKDMIAKARETRCLECTDAFAQEMEDWLLGKRAQPKKP